MHGGATEAPRAGPILKHREVATNDPRGAERGVEALEEAAGSAASLGFSELRVGLLREGQPRAADGRARAVRRVGVW